MPGQLHDSVENIVSTGFSPFCVVKLRSEPLAGYIAERGSEPSPSTGAEFDAFIASEIVKWGRAVKVSGATAD